MPSKKVPILGVQTDGQTFSHAIETLTAWAQSTDKHYVCTTPVYTIMQAFDEPRIKQAINGADMVTADGMPVVWVQRRRGAPFAERVYGPDIMLAVCERTAALDVSHYFLGGADGVAQTLADKLTARFPGLKVAGIANPVFPKVPTAPDPDVVKMLNDSRASIIWVGLGSPKQDIWCQVYRSALNAPLLIAVGAAFDFHAGIKKQAPRWMQRSGTEWIFRLVQEPRRLASRYLIHNPRYIWHVLREGSQQETTG
jgi:N-acetylglucosaminyldiphosphoundecaprenol N-acetyl-beta-D-mannosaminyltransferase